MCLVQNGRSSSISQASLAASRLGRATFRALYSAISAATHEGVDDLMKAAIQVVAELPVEEKPVEKKPEETKPA